MRITVLGGCGAWPLPGQACSGFLVEQDGFRLILDLGYATVPRLPSTDVDAVIVSHGHPDHCADLNPLLRARVLRADPAPRLPVYAPGGALDAVLALDRPGMLDSGLALREFTPGDRFEVGPFRVETALLPHWEPNAGLRLSAGGRVLAYTGDSGPSPMVARLARDADLFLAEASFLDDVPAEASGFLSSATIAGAEAAQAAAGHLVLTHLLAGTSPAEAIDAARSRFRGEVTAACSGLVLRL
ncbi:MBL fold metallo-hydrolase [Actinoplanes cyaneus]|uniref:MBL fold metallo-hydrolase n=1 Tax=Actinoplanes cyaneus TaxID=52696 RepID=A0A919ISW5_9ACTN|nr:MBL fold metallo-hydrolase [Actinoplanes cyaneus]MCW2143849.1 Ribonuclease BN, tRNA processing enzyme [Actinoplanes cyaneus]GID70651.1 MBL fold metallo-hydrolase [Actinoplanes cyaneus]